MSGRAWRLGPVFLAAAMCLSCDSFEQDGTHNFANTLGMSMIRIEPGSFVMGSDLTRDYWGEGPSHRVTISQPFVVSETEVTVSQYRQFRPDFKPDGRFGDYASGVSWYDPVKFCQWLSEKEGKTYRLPTEAEWEYACRAGTTTRFWSGEKPPSSGRANPWGLRNMHDGIREWCYDWHGEYPDEAQTDPVGPECGVARVVRGGCLDDDNAYRERKIFNAASSRAAIAPSFGLIRGAQDRSADLMNTERVAGSDLQLKPGLVGTWFGNSDLSNAKEQMLLVGMDNNWVNNDNRGRAWSARWRGYIEAPYSGAVAFEMQVTTGGILQIDGEKIIDQWTGQGTSTGRMQMVKGNRYPMVLAYQRSGGDSYLRVRWRWPGREMQIIPGDALSHSEEDSLSVQSESGNDDVPPGRHWIGFRVVQGSLPNTRPSPCGTSYVRQGLRANADIVTTGPAGSRPYFRKRYLLPVPLDNSRNEEIDAVGDASIVQASQPQPCTGGMPQRRCAHGDLYLLS